MHHNTINTSHNRLFEFALSKCLLLPNRQIMGFNAQFLELSVVSSIFVCHLWWYTTWPLLKVELITLIRINLLENSIKHISSDYTRKMKHCSLCATNKLNLHAQTKASGLLKSCITTGSLKKKMTELLKNLPKLHRFKCNEYQIIKTDTARLIEQQ
jgi:hypothetical protein